MRRLLTIGYAGHDPASFLAALQHADVEAVVDVRRVPFSRKPGFSRTALARLLGDAGLEYAHAGELGVPQALRDQLRSGERERTAYLAEFRAYLQTQPGPLDELFEQIGRQTCCLLCLEADWRECHRAVVADELSARHPGAVEVVHLPPAGRGPANPQRQLFDPA